MKLPSCSVCMVTYNEVERVPLMLNCGHSFCKACLAQLFEKSNDHMVTCPRCRAVSRVGNSVESLRTNYGMLSLIVQVAQDAIANDESDSDEERIDVISNTCSISDRFSDRSRCTTPLASPGWPAVSGCNGQSVEITSHHLRLLRQLNTGSRNGNDVWSGVLTAPGGCRHKVAVKRVEMFSESDLGWIQVKMEGLRRATMWCQNVCAIHGLVVKEGKLCVVMDKYQMSLTEAMRLNGGRLTLEQILRFGADIARGMSELHAAGVTSMSLKPSNILIDQKGRAVVSDYGLPEILKRPNCRKARQFGSEEVHLDSHSCRECLGLFPNYLAPEAWEPLKKSSLALFWEDSLGFCLESDVYSFGCTLVEMCTGVAPWAGVNTEEIRKQVVKARRQPPQYAGVVGGGVPPDLWKTIGDCIQFRLSKRPTFHAMISLFLRLLQEMPLSPPESPYIEVSKEANSGLIDSSSSSVLEFIATDDMALHRTVAMADLQGTRDVIALAQSDSTNSSVHDTAAANANIGNIVSNPPSTSTANFKLAALLDAKNDDGRNPIHVAAMRGYDDILGLLLLSSEADVESPDRNGNPAIMYAISSGSVQCLRRLIERNANVNFRLRDGMGPSLGHVCASYGEKDCLEELLKAGADTNCIDSEGDTLLHKALVKGFEDCAIAIVKMGGVKSMGISNLKGVTPLHLAVSGGLIEVIKCWVAASAPEDIKSTIDFHSPSGNALCLASSLPRTLQKETRSMVDILLSSGANPSEKSACNGFTCLHFAAFNDDVEMLQCIFSHGVDINTLDLHKQTALHVALKNGSNNAIKLLTEQGTDFSTQDEEGNTAVHIAAITCLNIASNLTWLKAMVENPLFDALVKNAGGNTVADIVEDLPREIFPQDLLEAFASHGVVLSPPTFSPGDWVSLKPTLTEPKHGWQSVPPGSVGFVQAVREEGSVLDLVICAQEFVAMATEVNKVLGLEQGQLVRVKRSVSEPRFGWRGQSPASEGTILCVDDDALIRVGFKGSTRGWKADPRDLSRIVPYTRGDWIRVKTGSGDVPAGSIGVVQSLRADFGLLVSFNFTETSFQCEPEHVENVEPFQVGSKLSVKRSVPEPRYGWRRETHHSVATVCQLSPSGLVTATVGTRTEQWQLDPADVFPLEDIVVGDWVRIRPGVPSPKYGWEDVTKGSVGVVFAVDEEGDIGIGFGFRTKLFECSMADVQKVTPFSVGQTVRLLPAVHEPRLGYSGDGSSKAGKVISIDMDGTLNVQVPQKNGFWRLSPGDAEVVSGLAAGDWVQLRGDPECRDREKWGPYPERRVAVVHSVGDNGYLELAGSFHKGRWSCHFSEVTKTDKLKVGMLVRFRAEVGDPAYPPGVPGVVPRDRSVPGIVVAVHGDGEVRVSFPESSGSPLKVDPGDLETIEVFEVGDWVRVRPDLDLNPGPVFGWRDARPGSVGVVKGWLYDVSPHTLLNGALNGNLNGTPPPTEGEEGCRENNVVYNRVVLVNLCGQQEPWLGLPEELERFPAILSGQRVKVKPGVDPPRFGWSTVDRESTVCVTSVDFDGLLRVELGGPDGAWLLDPSEVVLAQEQRALTIGDWVRVRPSVPVPAHQWGEVSHSSVGVVHRVDEEGDLWVAFCFLERLWMCKPNEMERARALGVGERCRIKEGVVSPRLGWGNETRASRGVIAGVDADGKVRVRFRRRESRLWVGDPADIEVLEEGGPC